MSVQTILNTVEADAVGVLNALPNLPGILADVHLLAAGVAHGEGGIAKVAPTLNNLSKLLADMFGAYAAFHIAQASVTPPVATPPSN